jgi:hypothetical protein
MKNYFFVSIVFLSCGNSDRFVHKESIKVNSVADNAKTVKYVKKIETQCEQNLGYRLLLSNDTSSFFYCDYSFSEDIILMDSDSKIEMIEELLSYSGDTSFSSMLMICRDLRVSTSIDSKTRYQIQVEALYLINYIYFNNWDRSPFPILISKHGGKDSYNSPEVVKQAYIAYSNWFSKVRKIGISESLIKGIMPLDDSDIFWLYGSRASN